MVPQSTIVLQKTWLPPPTFPHSHTSPRCALFLFHPPASYLLAVGTILRTGVL